MRRLSVLTLAIVSVVIVAGAAGGWYILTHSSTTPPAVVPDGPTFYQALASVNRSIASASGGPWALYAVWGIATPLPLSPNSLAWPNQNQTVNACGAQFNGLTLWNGSIPLFNGTFDSGTAPFWQFAFFSNYSQTVEIATDVLGVAHAYAPVSYSNACILGSVLFQTPWRWAQLLTPFPADSPKLASAAWSKFGAGWTSHILPFFEAFVFGFSYWGSANPMGLVVKYSRCGLVGATAVQPVAYVLGRSDGTTFEYVNGTQGCGNVHSLNPTVIVPYTVQYTGLTTQQSNASWLINLTLTLGYYGEINTDAGGLTTWMTSFNLTNSTGAGTRMGSPSCLHWVPAISSCHANASGWYLVLTSSSGEWLDAYGETPNGPSWVLPNVAFVSQQHLFVVAPAIWNLTGDTLSLSSTTAEGPASGSTTL